MTRALPIAVATALLSSMVLGQSPTTRPLAPHGLLDFDVNRDGCVTRGEYLANAIRRFMRMDANGNSSLTIQERNTERGPGSGLPLLRPASPGGAPEAGIIDADGDGLVSRDEYFFNIGRIYSRYDANDDDKVTPDEVAPASAASGPSR